MIDTFLVKKASRLSSLKLKDDKNEFDIPMVGSGDAKTTGCILKGLNTIRRKGKSSWATVKGNQQITVMFWIGALTITGSYEVITDKTYRVNLRGKATSAEIKVILLSKPNAKKGCCSSVKLTKMTGFDIEVDSGEAVSSMLINSVLGSTKEHYEPSVKQEIEKEIESMIKEELKLAGEIAITDICENPKVDALAVGNNAGEIYIFSDRNYWTFDIRFSSLSDQKEIKELWRNVIVPIDAADLIRIDDIFYMIFIKDNLYWMYKSERDIENIPKLVSSGLVKMKLKKKVRAIQFSTSTAENNISVSCTICTNDYIVYDCQVNTTIDIRLYGCTEVTAFSDILPQKTCESLTYADLSIIVIADNKYMVTTNLSRRNAFEIFNFKDDIYKCGQHMKTIAVTLVAGCTFLVVANIAVVVIIFEKKKQQSLLTLRSATDTEKCDKSIDESSNAGSEQSVV